MPRGFVISHIGVYQSEIFDTYKNPIEVTTTINGHWCKFLLKAPRDGAVMSWGCGCDQAIIDDTKVTIAIPKPSSWFGQTIEIGTNILSSMPKEGKGGPFVGRVYSTKPLKEEFKRQLLDLYGSELLSSDFLSHIKRA